MQILRLSPWGAGLVMSLFLFPNLGILAASPAPPPTTPGLFMDSPQQGDTDAFHRSAIIRSRFVGINLGYMDGTGPRGKSDTLRLNLFSEVTLNARLDRVEDAWPNGYIWVGHLEGVPFSQVSLVVQDGIMAGTVANFDETYAVRYAGNGVHSIIQVDPGGFPPESPPLIPPILSSATKSPMAVSKIYLPVLSKPSSIPSGPTINVLVVYTLAAQTAAGGATAMNALINLGVSETNTSYQNSGINQRISLANAVQVGYTESGSMNTDLTNLTNGTGALSSVPTLRNTYAADLVTLWIQPSGSSCGIAWLMANVSASFAPNGFSVIAENCVSPNYSFAHEMGHNMGASHDWYTDASTLPYVYAHGYVNLAARWRTIMAYNDQCSASGFNCQRILFWSNPDVLYSGAPMGVPEGLPNPADNRKTLNNTATTVSSFR